MRILLPIFLVIFCLQSCVKPDDNNLKPSDSFVKYFGASGNHKIKDMLVDKNNDIIILSDQQLLTQGSNTDFYIIKTDTVGNELASLTIDVATTLGASEIQTQESAQSVVELANGYLIIGNYSQIEGGQLLPSSIFWARLSINLELEYFDTIRSGNPEVNFVRGNDIIQTSDGLNVLVGATDFREINDKTLDAQIQYFLIKKDFQDSTYWRKSYGYPDSDDEIINAFEVQGDNIAVIGNTSQVANGGLGGLNVSTMILNPLATSQISDEIYGVSNNLLSPTNPLISDENVNDVIRISGGFVIVGTTRVLQNSRPFLMGLYEQGGIIFNNIIDNPYNLNTQGKGVSLNQNGEFVVVGSFSRFLVTNLNLVAPDKNGEVMFVKTTQTGIPLDVPLNFGLVAGDDEAEVVIQLPDGRMIVGATIDFGSNQTMIALLKLSSSGLFE